METCNRESLRYCDSRLTFRLRRRADITVIAIALRSTRIPLLAPFWPDYSHLHHKASSVSVSEIFDLSELIARYDIPIVDLLELKVGLDVDKRHRSVVYDGEHARQDVKVGERIMAEEPSWDDFKCWNAYLSMEEETGDFVNVCQPGGRSPDLIVLEASLILKA